MKIDKNQSELIKILKDKTKNETEEKHFVEYALKKIKENRERQN